jgi:aryl-alcohol dehydrogenase-like predicted oxidoreductase
MRVSRIGMGVWQFSGDAWGAISYEQAKAVVAKAVDVGINFFDTAAVYGRGRSEEYLGRAVKELGLRDRVYIATKIHGERLRRIDVLTSVENQRRRLGVDAIDLYQIHWPACWHNTHICETLEELINKDLVRYDVSNFPVQLLDYARTYLSRVAEQIQPGGARDRASAVSPAGGHSSHCMEPAGQGGPHWEVHAGESTGV